MTQSLDDNLKQISSVLSEQKTAPTNNDFVRLETLFYQAAKHILEDLVAKMTARARGLNLHDNAESLGMEWASAVLAEGVRVLNLQLASKLIGVPFSYQEDLDAKTQLISFLLRNARRLKAIAKEANRLTDYRDPGMKADWFNPPKKAEWKHASPKQQPGKAVRAVSGGHHHHVATDQDTDDGTGESIVKQADDTHDLEITSRFGSLLKSFNSRQFFAFYLQYVMPVTDFNKDSVNAIASDAGFHPRQVKQIKSRARANLVKDVAKKGRVTQEHIARLLDVSNAAVGLVLQEVTKILRNEFDDNFEVEPT